MKKFSHAVLILILTLGLALAGCGGGNSGPRGDTVINITAIPGVVVPIRNEVPVTTAIDTAQYTGSITWSPADNTFAATTVYTANIVLTAKPGYTLSGVAENFFTVAGATAVANAANSGAVTAVFPATGAASDVNVTFLSAAQTGGTSGTTDSTGLTLTFSADPTTLTADNITVTGATKGAFSGSGTTRTLAISNITVADGATVSVTITSPAGYSITGSPQTAVVYRLILTIGMDYLGGKIAYILQPGDPGYDANIPHGLIAATADQSAGIIWAVQIYQSTSVPGVTSTTLGTGSANTDKIIAQNVAGITYAAGLARAYNGGGYSDWYLPSKVELNKLSVNSVAIGGFFCGLYWSSSEGSASEAWMQGFNGAGNDALNEKYFNVRVRAVRTF